MKGTFSAATKALGPTTAASTCGNVQGAPGEVIGGRVTSIFVPDSGTPVGTMQLQYSDDNGTTWYVLKEYTSYPILDRVPLVDQNERRRLYTKTGWTGTNVPARLFNSEPME